MMRPFRWLLPGTLLIFAGCGHSDLLWTESHNFPSNTWGSDACVAFEPDTASLQKGVASKALLTIRYAEGASMRSFPISMEIESPSDGYYLCDTIKAQLLPREARTGDKATFGIFETTDTILLNQAPRPGWRMILKPAADDDIIKGLFSITLTLLDEK